jgi:YYY domain-containing protein
MHPAHNAHQGETRRARLATLLALLAILIVGATLRLTGLDWDDSQHLHPDERFLTMVENNLAWPETLSDYWDTAVSPLNPYNRGHGSYVYGVLPVFITKAVGQATGLTGYGGVYLAGRAVSALMDLLCVLLVYAIGARLYDRRVGLLGALLLALSALNIQQAHYFTVDTTLTFFVTLAFYLAVRVAQEDRWRDRILLGLVFGLAVACKISVLTFGLVIALAFALAAWRRGAGAVTLRWQHRRLGRYLFHGSVRNLEPKRGVEWDWLLLRALELAPAALVILLLAAAAFRVAQPHAFQGSGFLGLKINPQWQDDMSYVRRLVSGEIDYPPSHQWASRPPVWYMLKNLVLWGVGLPLGVAIWAAWALMAWELLKGRSAHLLPWAWMTFTFGYQSIQFVKAMRYILPIYPTMALVAAYGLVWLWEAAGRVQRRRWLRVAGRAAVGGVVLATALWALAFTSIYTRPVTRIAASRWVYEHIPRGSTISFELWDDAVPMNVDGHLASDDYAMIRMEPYWEDVPEKREALLQWLDETEYIALSSNRLYGSIPRLPQRYPMTTRYYELLFSGELGYERVAEFVSRPQLLGLEFVDDDADESFTVYDHPKVTIFHKTPAFDLQAVRAEFERYDLERVVRVMPRDADRAPHQLMLTDQALAAQRAGGTWRELYDRDSAPNRWPTFFWLLALYAVQVAAWPSLARLARALPDAGHGLSKAFGLLLVAYMSWLLPALQVARYSSALVWCALALLAMLGGWQVWRHGKAWRDVLRRRWRLLLMQEALFLLLFLAMWLIRRANPDLWHPVVGGEKPMDLAYFNAVLKSSTFPPYDPWFAGGAMNYYYWGWVIVAALVKLTGIVPAVAYNLALPTLFALLGAGVASVVLALASRGDEDGRWLPHGLRVGLLGVALVAIVGNLGELQLLAQGLISLGAARTMPGTPAIGRLLVGLWAKISTGARLPFRPEWWYWNATRVMAQGEINEFPFFSYLYGDLHAHVMALPFTVLALGLALVAARRLQSISTETDWQALTEPGGWVRWGLAHLPGLVGPLLALSVSIGALWGINTWDWPTYAGLAAVALVLGATHGHRAGRLKALGAAALLAVAVLGLSRLLYQPYHAHYGMAYARLALWKGERTPLAALLIIHALPLFVLGAWLVRCTRSNALAALWRCLRLARRYGLRRTRQLVGVLVGSDLALDALLALAIAVLVLMLAALIAGQWALLVAAPLGLLALAELLSAPTLERRLVGLLAGAMAFLMLFVDYLVLGGDVGRMNTVFKFSLQAWVLGGIASAVALGHLLRRRERWPGWAKAVLALLLVAVALYPPLATYGRVNDRWPESTYRGLDGSAFMAEATYQDGEQRYALAHDLAAIRWLQDHVTGSPTIVEAVTPLYRWGGRISVHTGLPTVLGWDWHQRQQRAAAGGQVVDWRIDDVGQFYNSPDPQEALRIIARHDIALIYVGEVERAYYDAAGLAKFDAMVGSALELVYDEGPVRIYQVLGADVVTGAAGDTTAGGQAALAALRAWLDRHVIWGPVRAEGVAGEALLLDQPVDTLPVARVGWNAPANAHWPLALVEWYLALQLLGWGAFGLLSPALRWLDDRGHGLSKGLGLVLASYAIWLPANLGLPTNTSGVIWAVTLALVALGAAAAWRSGSLRGLAWRTVLVQEGVFAGALLALVAVRLLNPDLWQPWYGGEKLMESAYLQAVARSETMPPYDPYFAGGRLNYYYLGLFQANIPLKLVGLRPEIAFNLAVPTLFALTASHALWAGRQLAGGATRAGWTGGVAALLLVAVAGNLTGGVQLIEQVAQVGLAAQGEPLTAVRAFGVGLRELLLGRAALPTFDYWWRATRVIPFTINEFPFFGFLFADLHPHLTALPLTTLTVALLAGALRAPRRAQVSLGLLIAVCYGALGPANTWDLPALGLAVAGGGLVWGLSEGERRSAFVGVLWALATVALGIALYAPFYRHYEAQGIGLGLVSAPQRSALVYWLQLWGLFVVGVLGLALVGPAAPVEPLNRKGRLLGLTVVVLTVAAAVALAWLGAETLALLTPLLAAALWLWAAERRRPEPAFGHLLLALALAILAGVELVYLRDFLDGSEWSRMNTVFKFHLQAWVLLSIALGAAWPRLWSGLAALGWPGRAMRGLLGALAGVALLYPLLATPVRIAERMPFGEPPRWTLDGVAFMVTGAYDWPAEGDRIELRHDLEAIRWLQVNAPGNAIVAEAPIGYYREGGLRLASFTGLPTLVGMHQGEQRPWTQVMPRQQDAEAIYTSTDPQRVADVLERLRVRYVYWGQLERAAYPQNDGRALARLEEQGTLSRVLENAGGVLWEYTGVR